MFSPMYREARPSLARTHIQKRIITTLRDTDRIIFAQELELGPSKRVQDLGLLRAGRGGEDEWSVRRFKRGPELAYVGPL